MSQHNKFKGLQLISAFQLAMPFIIRAIDASLHKKLNVGKPFLTGNAYIIMACSTTASGNLYFLIVNDIGEFVWVPEGACEVVNYMPQQQRVPDIMIPKGIKIPA